MTLTDLRPDLRPPAVDVDAYARELAEWGPTFAFTMMRDDWARSAPGLSQQERDKYLAQMIGFASIDTPWP